MVNEALLARAQEVLNQRSKAAFVAGNDPNMDPAMAEQGGGAPMDPSMAAAGGPPMDPAMAAAGGQPMDPSMAAAGGPPMDPAMAGAAPPPQDPQAMIAQIVQEQLAAAGVGGEKQKPAGKYSQKLTQISSMLDQFTTSIGGSPIPVAGESDEERIDHIAKTVGMLLDRAGVPVSASAMLGGEPPQGDQAAAGAAIQPGEPSKALEMPPAAADVSKTASLTTNLQMIEHLAKARAELN